MGKIYCQVDHVKQSIRSCDRAVVPGYHIGQAVLPCGTYGQDLVQGGSCGAVCIVR